MTLVRAPSRDEYRRSPVGRTLAGSHWLAFCFRPDLYGFALWGRPDAASTEHLVDAIALELDEGVPRHRALVDATRLESAEVSAFAALERYVQGNHAKLGRKVSRLAIAHSGGMPGAIVAGFYRVLRPPYPVQHFRDAEAGFRWLDEDEPAALAGALDGAIAEERGQGPVVGALSALLAARPRLSIQQAARALAVSARTLQRRLAGAGTSFSTVQAEVRLRQTMLRLEQTTDSLTAIAVDVGFASLQHMSAAFKKATGQSPSVFRAQNHAGRQVAVYAPGGRRT